MTQLEKSIKATQRRLWFIRWTEKLTTSFAIAASLFAIIVLVQRLWGFPMPFLAVGITCAVAALIGSIVWTVITRESVDVAAATLDLAAGLKERLSSGRYCIGSDDPFEAAVVADADRLSRNITVRQHVRFRMPKSLTWMATMTAVAAMMFLITPGLLQRTEAAPDEGRTAEVKQAKLAVKRELDQLRDQFEDDPDLAAAIAENEERAEGLHVDALTKPGDIRHEAVKRIDNMSDKLRQKMNRGSEDPANEFRKRLRRLKVPQNNDAMTKELGNAMARGDFKTAKEEVAKLKEQLATLKSEEDKEMVEKMGKELQDLAKELDKLAQNKELMQKLQQAGVDPEKAKRMLERLTKKDLEELAKKMQEQGMSQKDIQKMKEQMEKQAGASQMAQQMSKAMQKCSSGCKNGQLSDAASSLAQAEGQLSELESMQQEMDQMKSQMAALDQARNNLDGGSKGDGQEGGQGGDGQGDQPGARGGQGQGGMGSKFGQGKGGKAPEQQTGVGFKTERTKVKTGKGAIVSQMEVPGEQVEGEVSRKERALQYANEREASDRVPRDRIPRQYHKAIKKYFDTMPDDLDRKSDKNDKENTPDSSKE
ncbi:MAG: hypothetical protein ACPGXK_06215 [Phycisphaerae bacterium]